MHKFERERGSSHKREKAHEPDLEDVIQRAKDAGCWKLMVTGSDLEESKEALLITEKHRTPPNPIGYPL